MIVFDSFRRPADQLTAALYVLLVRIYQWIGRPLTRPICKCRFLPTCSEYSIEAVQTHGIRRGLYLTAKRLMACNGKVPMGTWDPVPAPDAVQ